MILRQEVAPVLRKYKKRLGRKGEVRVYAIQDSHHLNAPAPVAIFTAGGRKSRRIITA